MGLAEFADGDVGFDRRARVGLLSSRVLADESETPEQQAAALANVPKDAQQYYQGYWYSTKLVADPLANWQPHRRPGQICHNDSDLGNSWRANSSLSSKT